ncbi:heparan sulfate glucosamine 3-o-sulfotransferase 5 [Plakobranchus ocellatus]|uniref:Heparan sulfate glucosamine 3-o-sulfotransferase 5 n=1 Tax=Plakobranchus ocellatus TaxID=259542 RepID=A0AAV4AWW1_9GAST|nr:heparan sulfate glucosamine 3-o-sulfotransferase 5 [Plakobranchus ocellatus]
MGGSLNRHQLPPNYRLTNHRNDDHCPEHQLRGIFIPCDPRILTLTMAKPSSNSRQSYTSLSLRNGLVAPRWSTPLVCCSVISSVLNYLRNLGIYVAKKSTWTALFIPVLLFVLLLTLFTDFIPFNRASYSVGVQKHSREWLPPQGSIQNYRPQMNFTLPLNVNSDALRNVSRNTTSLQQGHYLKRFPSCIIFGVSKCGTKAVIEYLKLHPDVVAPKAEINYFNNETLQHQHGLGWYIQQMPPSLSHQITVEKSPDYFQNHQCADLIRAAAPSTKLILLLREPIERLVSEYMQLSEKSLSLPDFEKWVIGQDTGDVDQKVPSVMVSAYADHVSYWLRVFPREQVHIIESQSLRDYPLHEMRRLETFLHLQPFYQPEDFYFNSTRGFYCMRMRYTGKTKCLGKSKGREHITVSDTIMDKLVRFYQPYNQKLKQILGAVDFPWL